MDHRSVAGLTVIELLVTVGVIAVLVVVLVTQFRPQLYIFRSRQARLAVDVKEVKQALARYYANHADYPGNLDEAGVNFIFPDRLNYETNNAGNPYINPQPTKSAAKELVEDKELKSAILGKSIDVNTSLDNLQSFIFVAKRQFTETECSVGDLGTLLDRPKVCWLVDVTECRQAKDSKADNYYTACESGGAFKGLIPLQGISQTRETQLCTQNTTIADGGFKFWVYRCQ